MRKSILCAVIVTLTCAFTANAQNFVRLEKLADQLRVQSEDLVARTNKELRKEGNRSSKEIKNAFLAEQLRASALLIERIIDNRFHSSEVRYAGMVLAELSEKFPEEDRNSFEWKKAKDTINELSREMRGLNPDANIGKVEYRADEASILGKVVWSGMVDADVLLSVSGDRIKTKTVSGKEYADGAYSFTSTIPRQTRIRVGVTLKSGRGKVHVIEQPGRENDYTAIVQIRDEEGGAKPYAIEIYWYRR